MKSSKPKNEKEKKGPKKASPAAPKKPRDLFQILNRDCIFQILNYLPPRAVLNCSNVNVEWNAVARDWINEVGFRLHCPGTNISGIDGKVKYLFTEIVRRNERLEDGRPMCAQCLEKAWDNVAVQGGYITYSFKHEPWLERQQDVSREKSYDGYYVFWQTFPSFGSKVRKGRIEIYMGVPMVASVNADGNLVVCVDYPENDCYKSLGFSLKDEGPQGLKCLIWHHVCEIGREMVPRLIGRNRIYFFDRAGRGNQIGACELELGGRLYKKYLGVSGDVDPEQWMEGPQLLPRGDEDIIIQRLKRVQRTILRVIDGKSGIIIQEFSWSSFRSAYHERVQVIPETGYFRVVSSFVFGAMTVFEDEGRLFEPFNLGGLILEFSMDRNGTFICTNTAALMPGLHHPEIHPTMPVAYACVKIDQFPGDDFRCVTFALEGGLDRESRQRITDAVRQALGDGPFDFTIDRFVRPGGIRFVKYSEQPVTSAYTVVKFVNANWLEVVFDMQCGNRYCQFLRFM